jgi:hypothetical protein
MKNFVVVYLCLTLILGSQLLGACKQKAKPNVSSTLMAYNEAVKAQDYNAAATLLLQIAANDSASNPWVYDSLTLYHYVFLTPANMVRNPASAKYYSEKGLKINPNNEFLLEMKAKLLLEEQKDTASFEIMQKLWNKTGDYTYLWEMTLVELLRKKQIVADSMVNSVLKSETANTKTVRITDQMRQTVNAKAAFLYIKATLANAVGDYKGTAELLNQSLQLQPNFYMAQKGLYELQQNMAAGRLPNR